MKYDVRLNLAILVKWSRAFYEAFVSKSNISSDFNLCSGGIFAFFIISCVWGKVFNRRSPIVPRIRWGMNHHTVANSDGIMKNRIKNNVNSCISITELQNIDDINSSIINSILTIKSIIENVYFRWELVGKTALDNIIAPSF